MKRLKKDVSKFAKRKESSGSRELKEYKSELSSLGRDRELVAPWCSLGPVFVLHGERNPNNNDNSDKSMASERWRCWQLGKWASVRNDYKGKVGARSLWLDTSARLARVS